jgi:hypothetical protein
VTDFLQTGGQSCDLFLLLRDCCLQLRLLRGHGHFQFLNFAMLFEEFVDDPKAALRGVKARTYIHLGEAYSALASSSQTAPDKRREHWRTARNMYEQSLDIWNDLRNRGTLGGDDAAKPGEAAGAIAKCDAVLGKSE